MRATKQLKSMGNGNVLTRPNWAHLGCQWFLHPY